MKYSILLIDPPWVYNDRKLQRLDGKVPKAGVGAGNHYSCMTTEDLAALPILAICDYPCAVFIWTTGPHLFAPEKIVAGWNKHAALVKHRLRYTNKAFCWQKITKNGITFPGRGHWCFHSTEDCLLFMRGSMKVQKIVHEEIRVPHPRNGDNKIIHSAKPPLVRERIVEMFGDLPRIELFARDCAPGWNATGLDYDGVDIRDFLGGAA